MFFRFIFLFIVYSVCIEVQAYAQDPANNDTFFLAKKKGLLGRLGKSIATNPPNEVPQKIENQYLKYKGKIIRRIELIRLGFESNIADTITKRKSFGVRIANTFHKNTSEKVIRNNLFFQEGYRLYPYLLADNERYLRELVFLKDARIFVEYAENGFDSVDVIVMTKDIFSLGANLKVDTRERGRMELQEENLGGTGTRIFLSGLYDQPRQPQYGYNGELTIRNIKGSFINWTSGFTNFSETFNTGNREETHIYSRLEKPLVTPYIPTTGSLEVGYFASSNGYHTDSLFKSDVRYTYYNIDGWFGFSLHSKRSLYLNKELKLHNFFAIRAFKEHFFTLPVKYQAQSDYRYNNFIGGLASVNIFKQLHYKTNFIYGFGRNEDVPEGYSISFIGGWIRRQLADRPYSGIDFTKTNFNKKGFYNNFTLRAGGFFYRHRFEDVNLLFNVEHFSRLKKMGSNWYNRFFINSGITAQINPVSNEPLYINSSYGLPYFNTENLYSDLRSTVKLESVFYNTKKILGFRFALFTFSDFIGLKPSKQDISKTALYTAFGGGIRTRNENLVFGTIELRGYYFPRTNGDMNPWKIDLSSNIRFKYNSTFIKRPDFVNANQ